MQPADNIVYCSPDWRQPETPLLPAAADVEHPALLARAHQALDQRQARYPAMIASGRISAQTAAQDIAGWQALCAEWQWIVDGSGDLPPRETFAIRLAAVNLAIERAESALSNGQSGDDLAQLFSILLAMRWHLTNRRYGDPAVHFWAALTRTCRRDADLRKAGLCPVCEHRADDPAIRAYIYTDCGLPRLDPRPAVAPTRQQSIAA